jgi:hypothetical protein
MHTAPLVLLALLTACTARAAEPLPSFTDSPHRAAIPGYGACDVVVTPDNYLTTLAQYSPSPHVNSPGHRVFCVEPGDYRGRGEVLLLASGTEQSRRFLRFHADDGVENAAQRGAQAIFEAIKVVGSWWVIQGLTIQPQTPSRTWFLSVVGGDHNVLDGNLVDGGQQANTLGNNAVLLMPLNGDPATHNTVQRNLVRNGNQSRIDADYLGIVVGHAQQAGDDNDYNRIVDNEVVDWGDGIALSGVSAGCNDPGTQHGSVIDGNDVYLTAAKRIDCASGQPDPEGECACAENGIDVKAMPGAAAADWTRVTNNRVWGYRPTSPTVACGGSGSNGQAIAAGSVCARHVLVAKNVVLDSTTGVSAAGKDWIIAGNLLADIRATTATRYGAMAINASAQGERLDIQFNTMVDVDTAYDDGADDTDTRCNVVVDNAGLNGIGSPRGANHTTAYNFLYQSPTTNFVGTSNAQYDTAQESAAGEHCFWRKRWTTPERVCVSLAATTLESPHMDAVDQCDPDLAVSLGIAEIGFTTAPEPGAALAAAALLATLAALTTCRRCGASSPRAARAAGRRAARW